MHLYSFSKRNKLLSILLIINSRKVSFNGCAIKIPAQLIPNFLYLYISSGNYLINTYKLQLIITHI